MIKFAEQTGWDGRLTDWLYGLTKDCLRKQSPGLSDPCGAHLPDLPTLFNRTTWTAARFLTLADVRYSVAIRGKADMHRARQNRRE